jgi:hypothetical protein
MNASADEQVVLDQRRTNALKIALWGVAAIGMGLAVPSHRHIYGFIPAQPVIQITGFLLLALGLFSMARPCRLVLGRDGIEYTSTFSTTRIPWNAIQTVGSWGMVSYPRWSLEPPKNYKPLGVLLTLRSGKKVRLGNGWSYSTQQLESLIVQCRERWFLGAARTDASQA